jgi:hypothetical protein
MPQWREACTRVMWDAELLSIPLAVRGILSWRPVLGGTPMRQIFLLSAIVFLSAAGFAQLTVVSGYASNWTPPGTYAAPFAPLVTTPSVALETGLPTQVGASNATPGNVAGASSSPVTAATSMQAAYSLETPAQPQATPNEQPRATGFEFGIARFESSQGVAQLVGSSGKHSQTAKMYTNADVDQLNQANGTVQYGGKTERLD